MTYDYAYAGYGPGYDDGFVVQHLSTILVSPGDNRLNQIVYGNLLDRLTPNGPPELPKYKLIINLTESKRGVALERDATVSRFKLILVKGCEIIL